MAGKRKGHNQRTTKEKVKRIRKFEDYAGKDLSNYYDSRNKSDFFRLGEPIFIHFFHEVFGYWKA